MDTYPCGHPSTDENTYTRKSGRQEGTRRCRRCIIERQRDYTSRKRAGEDTRRRTRSECPKGHPYSPENTMIVDSRRDGKYRVCRACAAVNRAKALRDGYMRNYSLRRRYGITLEEYDAMVEAQGGLCAICRKRPASSVDHDHETQEIRGILCKGCNVAIGVLGDSSETIHQAVVYLAAHDKKG